MVTVKVIIKRIVKPITKWFAGIVPKDKKLILFSAWFGMEYKDNTKFLFEYMLKNYNYKVFWYTKNKELYKSLKEKGIPVLFSNNLRTVWLQCRAIMLVATVQTSDFNYFFYNKCFFFDIGHGFPGKPVGLALGKDWAEWFYYCRKGIEFYQTASSKFVLEKVSEWYDVDKDHYIYSNKPRIDILFDEELRQGINTKIDKIKNRKRLITYLPTHRSIGKKEMDITKIFDLKILQLFCEQTNSVFVIKKHFYHKNEVTELYQYPNIFDVTQDDIDTEVLLAQTDVLITDFSSCFIDYLTLDRPIVFYAYDYDDYMANERDYYWKYDMINGGYTAKNKNDLIRSLYSLSEDWNDSNHIEGRREMKRLYFDDGIEMGTSRQRLSKAIDDIIQGNYKPHDWN
jgi:CDP-glycerol glycerophosphotransferase (TagB/SpsB family)